MRDYEIKSNSITVDFTKGLGTAIPRRVVYSSGDINTSYINIICNNNDSPINLSDYEVTVNVIREDGNFIISDCKVLDSEKGEIEVLLTTSMLYVGLNYLEVTLNQGDRQLVSPIIPYKVVSSISQEVGEDIPNSNEYPILVKLIEEVREIPEKLEMELTPIINSKLDLIDNSINNYEGFLATISTNESERNENEETRKSQEILRQQSIENINTSFNSKVEEVDAKITETTNITIENTSKINNKIVDIDTIKSNMVEQVSQKIDEVNISKLEMINQVEDKMINCEDRMRNIEDNFGLLLEGTGLATIDYVEEKITDLVSSAPDTLDTLKELSDALGNDPNFATSIATQIGEKASKSDVYTKAELDKILENLPSNSESVMSFTKDITNTQWVKENNLYKVKIKHNLSAKNVLVSVIDKDSGENTLSTFKIVDVNNIEIYSSYSFDATISMLNTKVNILEKASNSNVDINDEVVSEDSTWSSKKIKENIDRIDEDLTPIDDDYIVELFKHDGDITNPRDYYTKDESDERFLTKEDIDLSNLATKEDIENINSQINGSLEALSRIREVL